MSKEDVAKSAIGVTLVMCLGYALSFGKEAVIAYYFGITKDVDAYTIAIQIPVVIFSFVAVAIQSVIVPLYSDLLYNRSKIEADFFVSNLWCVVLLFALIFCLLSECFAGGLIYLFAPGFKPEVHSLATLLLRITLPTVFMSLTAKVFTAVLNVHKKYVFPELSLLFLNTGLIITIVLLHARFGIIAACIGQIFGSLAQLGFLLIIVRKVYRPSLVFSPKDAILRQAMKMSLPVFWSISVAEINAMVNRMIASFLFVGSIAALSYAQKINSIFISFFTSAIATILYPMYAESAARRDNEQLNSRINLTVSAYLLFLAPIILYVICFRREIVTVAFARGAFDTSAIDVTQQLLGIYAIGILFLALRGTLTNVFYSLKDSKTPAANATIGVVINLLLNLTLPFVMGINGLALASVLSAIYITVMLVILLLKKHPELNLHMFFQNVKGIAVASLISISLTWGVKLIIGDIAPFLSLIIGFSVCASVYLLVVFLTHVPISATFFHVIFKRINKDETRY